MLSITQSSIDSLSLELTKKHLIVEHNEDDLLINSYIKASLGSVEKYLHKTIRSLEYVQTYISMDRKMAWESPVPNGAITLTYNGIEKILINGYEYNYDRDSDTNYFSYNANVLEVTMNDIPEDWDGADFTMAYDVGYEDMPDEVNQARLLLVGTWYEQRSSVSSRPTKVRELPQTVTFILDMFQGSPL